MTETNVLIRKAQSEDMIQVFNLIKELAKFEEMEDQVKISAKTLIKDGFESTNPAFNCLVAELNQQIIGYALYYTSYSTWLGKSTFLEDLYVQPSFQKNGIGKKLFMEIAKIAHASQSKRLDFHVLSWNPAEDFYRKLGAENLTVTEKWQLFRLNEQALGKLCN